MIGGCSLLSRQYFMDLPIEPPPLDQTAMVATTEEAPFPTATYAAIPKAGHLEKYPFRAACKSDSKNLSGFERLERAPWDNLVSSI